MAYKTRKVEYPDELYKHESEDKELRVYRETNPVDPRTWDNFGIMVCSHKKYNLGDEQPDASKYSGWEEIIQEKREQEDVKALLPLYLYDHSGITISTTPFNSRFDSMRVGFIYINQEKIEELGIAEENRTEEKLREYLKGDVETYDQYLRGEVYRFEYYVDGEEVDRCGGFFGDDREHMFEHITGNQENFKEVEVNESDY